MEDDELDMDYHPAQDLTEDDDDNDWEDHMDDGLDGDGEELGVSDGRKSLSLGLQMS